MTKTTTKTFKFTAGSNLNKDLAFDNNLGFYTLACAKEQPLPSRHRAILKYTLELDHCDPSIAFQIVPLRNLPTQSLELINSGETFLVQNNKLNITVIIGYEGREDALVSKITPIAGLIAIKTFKEDVKETKE